MTTTDLASEGPTMASLLPTTMLSVRRLSTTKLSTLDAPAALLDGMVFPALDSTLAIVAMAATTVDMTVGNHDDGYY